jgi:hypothetical protein
MHPLRPQLQKDVGNTGTAKEGMIDVTNDDHDGEDVKNELDQNSNKKSSVSAA